MGKTPASRLGEFLVKVDAKPQQNIFQIDVNEPKEIRDMVADVVYDLMPGVEVVVKRMEIGDYAYRDMGFERKSYDLANFPLVKQQCVEMLGAYLRPHLILDVNLNEVQLEMFQHSPVKAESLPGFVASLIDMGIFPIFCSDPEMMAEIMIKRCLKGTDGKDRSYRDPFRPGASESDKILHIIKAVSGVSTERGKALLGQFRTITGVAEASVDNLLEVQGIGPKTAEAIYDAFRGLWEGDENRRKRE